MASQACASISYQIWNFDSGVQIDYANHSTASSEADAVKKAQTVGYAGGDYEYLAHELPFFVYSMTATQCRDLVQGASGVADGERARLAETCDAILN